jgi:L-fucose mutarotase
MLKTRLLHPQILEALAEAGHGSRILIADSNFPMLTGSAASARRVYLNLAPGQLTVADVLRVLVDTIAVEAVVMAIPASGEVPPIHAEVRELLPDVPFETCTRDQLFDIAGGPDLALAIATGEPRRHSNVLLTIGVVAAD